MTPSSLAGWLPEASAALLEILDARHGPLERPNRSEIFGSERFAQHGRSLGETHRSRQAPRRATAFFPRLRENIRVLRKAHHYIGTHARTGYVVSPAAEWLLDNFHLIESQLQEIHEGLPRRYFRDLPVLVDEPLRGLPRVYGVAWAFVAHTDGAFDEDLLIRFLQAYQQTRELTLAELWALPTTLRVVLVENLRRLAERLAAIKGAREVANLVCDRLGDFGPQALSAVLALLERRGVGRPFLVLMAQRLQDHRNDSCAAQQEWLHAALPDLAGAQQQQPAEQAADNLSVSNAIGSLRLIGNADWTDLVSRTSTTFQLLLQSSAFESERADTRDDTLHEVEVLARRSARSETQVAEVLTDHMQRADAGSAASTAGHWLQGSGRPALMLALGLHERGAQLWHAVWQRAVLPLYLLTLASGTAGMVAWLLVRHGAAPATPAATGWLLAATSLAMLFPASEAVVAIINRLISESVRPSRLPRLAFTHGIPPQHRVLVVIPAMLSGAATVDALAHRLELHHLANPERSAQFALLTDWLDADSADAPTDRALLDQARALIEALNERHAVTADQPPRFVLLHRARTYSQTQRRWIGWERKRGKLEQLIAVLAEPATALPGGGAFFDLGRSSMLQPDTRYVVTLDADTQLPAGRLRELVGVAAHPYNQPQVDARTRTVTQGYGILQPRVVTPLPAAKDMTLYHWLFAGQCGIDPYSAASSEIYMDVFHEGTFTGKGLLHVHAMHAVLTRRLPDGQVLSHDLLEGAVARCAAVTDIAVIEDAPFHVDVAASRVHRWIRGDWQLLPFVLHPRRYGLRGVHVWKMVDNLRRSLVASASLALLLLALGAGTLSPTTALILVVLGFSAGPLMGAIAGLAPSRDDVAKLHFYRLGLGDLWRAACIGLWQLMQLPNSASANLDAALHALWRMGVSRRHLLEWTTAAAAQAGASTRLSRTLRQHWALPVLALVIWGGLSAFGIPGARVLTAALCLLWVAAPWGIWWFSRPGRMGHRLALSAQDQGYLHGVARDSWRLFERCIGPDDHHLPPDNLQLTPQTMVAHRTSPTNIGLYLLSTACARAFGWIGTLELLQRTEATLATLDRLARHRGHFLNWYDTLSATPLAPAYVSAVDSGNLSGHLLALAQACREFALDPVADGSAARALASSTARIREHAGAAPPHGGALAQLLALEDALQEAQSRPQMLRALLDRADGELGGHRGTDLDALTPTDEQQWAQLLSDHIAVLRSALLDAPVRRDSAYGRPQAEVACAARLLSVAARCERLAWEADYSFLYHPKRHLFHIGYRVETQQLDASFYDLLASESRLTSLLAIAKGDVPVSHWWALGRPYFAAGAYAGLRSWSGSMFEYLMPTLILVEPDGSVLRDAGLAALREQVAFARTRHVPWGISESAYAARDYSLAYQYAPQGVPRLALRRTPAQELVVAPYACALASLVAPHQVVANLHRLQRLHARSRYGFVEALDYTTQRQIEAAPFTAVNTFMAHHQGMTIVALTNVLLQGAPQRWGMSNPHIEAVGSLLHERAPREVSILMAPLPGPPPDAQQRRDASLQRDVVPGVAAVSPTHLLSNGRYSVALRANGAGWSRWGDASVSRWRDDAVRDAMGTFFFIRWDQQPVAVSLTQHPAPDPNAHYQCTYHADRMCFDAVWSDVTAHTTVWVSPEDDIEFREITLHNTSERSLDIELMSAFEVALADVGADEAHPAFSNLFVQARWRAAQQALMFERTPRRAGEPGLHAAHFLSETQASMQLLGVQVSRHAWLGRNRDPSQPAAVVGRAPQASQAGAPDAALTTGLDPVCALSVRIHLAPHASASLTFCTAASDDAQRLDAVIDKHRHRGPVARSSLMSATLAGIRLRALDIPPEVFAAIQTLTSAVVMTLSRPASVPVEAAGGALPACDRRLLWRFGMSGDRPVVLVFAGSSQGVGMLRTLVKALQVWSWACVACDVVVVNTEPASYLMPVQHDLHDLREQFNAQNAHPPQAVRTGLHVLRAQELSADETTTLRSLARMQLNADGRPLSHHVTEWSAAQDADLEARAAVSTSELPLGTASSARTAQGAFQADGAEFNVRVSRFERPTRAWTNVLANPQFGCHITESGGGYTWAVNSRLNQLTPWSNDPIADPAGEWFLLQDVQSHELWSVTPGVGGHPATTYSVTHGQGHTTFKHRQGGLDVQAVWCVDAHTSVKQVAVRVVNRGPRTRRLRVVGIAEWMMGAGRADRGTTDTACLTQRLAPSDGARARRLSALTCTQRDRSAGFGQATAFLALACDADEPPDWTCDRRECFDARGRLVVPDTYEQRAGGGLDPCAALSTRLSVAAGDTGECLFLLGFGANLDEARHLATRAIGQSAAQRLARTRATWDELLDATRVRTPDPLFDALVNRWLLYQTVACRLWAKAGLYQAGGAFGFRDQLQDAMALAWSSPAALRQQIVLNAGRQFAQGDVQHWWHAPTGAGVRTHFSDDLLWLPHACAHYLECTGDATLLDEDAAFLEGAAVAQGAEDVYDVPRVSDVTASVYEHCARAIDHSLRVGVHGLPLMGTGDWNDGMNSVGNEGRGESVWLGWFLCRVVRDFAPVARRRGQTERAQSWELAATGWRAALESEAWDGQWYKRAFFDDGTPLGSHINAECRIDLIAQAWSVLSEVAPAGRQHAALAAMDRQLVDPQDGLIKLLTPPLRFARPSAGYIQAYPPGVRENGGQYSHAGVWALIAQATRGDGDAAYRYFTYLSPAHRAAHPGWGPRYEIEPYVMAGDVSGEPPYVGRGGWSWYTGSAAWMHRAAIEHLFGVRQHGDRLSISPCLPSHWPQAEIFLQRAGRTLRIVVCRHDTVPTSAGAPAPQGPELAPGATLNWQELPQQSYRLLRLPAAASADATGVASALTAPT